MQLEEIVEKVLFRFVGTNLKEIDNWKEKDFFGNELNLSARSVAMFYIALEEELNTKFPEEAVVANGFSNFSNVLKILNDYILSSATVL